MFENWFQPTIPDPEVRQWVTMCDNVNWICMTTPMPLGRRTDMLMEFSKARTIAIVQVLNHPDVLGTGSTKDSGLTA